MPSWRAATAALVQQLAQAHGVAPESIVLAASGQPISPLAAPAFQQAALSGLLARMGVSPYALQALARHARVATTMKYYIHLNQRELAAQAVMRGMIAGRWGRMVFITSPTAELGRRGQCSYGAAKAGLGGLMRSLVWEVSRFQITVNCVCAGLVDTALTGELPEAVRAELLGSIPQNRAGRPEEIAALVDFLASERAGYITGQTLAADGGLSAVHADPF